MKKVYVIVIFFIFRLYYPAYSQILPLVESQKVWNVCWWAYQSPSGAMSISLGNDTLIGNYYYKEVLGDVNIQGVYSRGWIREDSLNRVYFLAGSNYQMFGGICNYDFSSEILLYDFRLHIGDTIHCGKLWEQVSGVYQKYSKRVLGMDTITVKGIARKRWWYALPGINLPCNMGGDTVIEGIGSSNGLLYPIWAEFENGFKLQCVTVSNVQVYPDTLCFCDLYSGINEKRRNTDSSKIFPNPCTTAFTIQLTTPPSAETYFQLYDALGRQVKREEINSTTTTIHRNNLPGGIYFWQLIERNKILERGKVVME